MNVKTRTKLYETIRDVLKDRSDHDINDDDQREVVVDDLAIALEREFRIRDRDAPPPGPALIQPLARCSSPDCPATIPLADLPSAGWTEHVDQGVTILLCPKCHD